MIKDQLKLSAANALILAGMRDAKHIVQSEFPPAWNLSAILQKQADERKRLESALVGGAIERSLTFDEVRELAEFTKAPALPTATDMPSLTLTRPYPIDQKQRLWSIRLSPRHELMLMLGADFDPIREDYGDGYKQVIVLIEKGRITRLAYYELGAEGGCRRVDIDQFRKTLSEKRDR